MLTPSPPSICAETRDQGGSCVPAVIHLSSQKASVVVFSPLSEIHASEFQAGAEVEERRSL